jgi:hypothetical protein
LQDAQAGSKSAYLQHAAPALERMPQAGLLRLGLGLLVLLLLRLLLNHPIYRGSLG